MIKANDNAITEVTFYHADEYINEENEWIIQCEKELNEYFNKKRKEFSVPIQLEGTNFQKKVWHALCQIPYGETRSYKDIAQKINNPKACRAIGSANHKNPICIIVPCHRIIQNDGKIGGYAGGINIKQQLLDIEK